ncbi:MAG: TonB-dependent receptor [Saprospiraceae bacterium]
MKTFLYHFCIVCLLVPCAAFSQTAIITGNIVNDEGANLSGATVSISKLSLSTSSDENGNYTLEIPAAKSDGTNYSISAAALGYETAIQELTATPGRHTLNFRLGEMGLTLQGVVVTAEKSEATLASETPISLTVFSGKSLESISAGSISDFIQNTPGVTATQLDEGYISLQIRGISTLSSDSPVGYYLDDTPFAFLNSPLAPEVNPFDLERVEVLRGPQGTLYGNGAMAGVVRMLTQNADTDKWGFKADLSAATTETGGPSYAAMGSLNAPIIKNKLAARVSGGYKQRGGFISNNLLGRDDINEGQQTFFRGKLNFTPTKNLSLRASIWTQKNDVGTYTLADSSYDHSTPFDEENVNDYTVYSGTIEYRFPKLHLYNSTSYSILDATLKDGSPVFARSDSYLGQTALTEEFRLSSRYDGPFDWLAGFYYWDGEMTQKTNISFLLPDNSIFEQPYIDSKSHSTQYAVFGEAYYRFLDDKMRATVGLRYFNETRNLEDIEPGVVMLLRQLGLEAKREATYKVVTPRFNLAYYPTKKSMIFATAAKGFRSGLVQNGGFLATAVAFGVNAPVFVNEENLWSYELGTKISTQDSRFLIESALYYNDWSDLIQTSYEFVDVNGTPTAVIFFLNAGKASALGLDLNAQYSAPMGLTLSIGGNVNQSQYEDDTPPALGAKKGDRISFVPKYTISSSALYSHKIFGDKLKGSIYANIQHNAEREDYSVGIPVSGDANTVLDARIGVEGKNWGVFLTGDNLTDERGVTYPSSALSYDSRLRPRTWGVNLKFFY